MLKSEYKVIGVMSGTSLDGIDLAYISFIKSESVWKFKIHSAETISYIASWKATLAKLIFLSKEELREIDVSYTAFLAEIINDFIRKYDITNIDAVCSHGHTALHQPSEGFTYQIGNLSELAELINQKVICDFRVQDVKLGGQGAPLVPIGDRLLFPQYDYCLNLGGFANISEEIGEKREAYDICPVNIILNRYTRTIGYEYDDNGSLAREGTVSKQLYDTLNSLSFYEEKPPKSLGLEWVQNFVFSLIDKFDLSIPDILRTVVEHVAFQTAKVIKPNKTVLVTGGGAYNGFLMNRIKALSKAEIVIPDENLIEYKEALIFGLLGVLKLRNEVNCLSSVTGSKHDHSSGVIFQP